MKKFIIFHYGFETPTPTVMEAWSKWFASLGDKMVDPGSPLGPGTHGSEAVCHTGARAVTSDHDLSPREREVLKWAAGGKTAWETAQVLGVAKVETLTIC